MTTLTKLLPPEAAPAQPILDRAHKLPLTLAERVEWPQEVKVDGDVITFGVKSTTCSWTKRANSGPFVRPWKRFFTSRATSTSCVRRRAP